MECRWLLRLALVLLGGGLLQAAAATQERAELLERELRYYQALGEGFNAISSYRSALAEGLIDTRQERWARLAARLYAGWGLYEEAQGYYQAPVLSASPEQRARNLLALGRAHFRRQRYVEAVRFLEQIRPRQLPRELEYERLLLAGVSLYHLGNFAGSSSHLWSIHPTSRLYPFARINIGMGSIKIGSWPGGISGLSSLRKRLDIDVEADPQFADRLNTVFGYLLLFEEYAGSRTSYGKVSMRGFTTPKKRGYRDALEMLKAVSEQGLYADKALLGRAWIAIDTNELEQARAILERLMVRDARHLVVQEARLALPYVLEREGDVARAIVQYRGAVRFFGEERERLDQLLLRLGTGELDELFLTMRRGEPERNPLTAYLPGMLLAPLWNRLLDDFEEIGRMRARLREWEGRPGVAAALRDELSRQRALLEDLHIRTSVELRREAQRLLNERRRRVNHYLNQARYGLAELYGRQEYGGVDAREALAAYNAYLEEAPEVTEEVREHILGRIADLELELGEEAREVVPHSRLPGVAAYLAELEKDPQEGSKEDLLYKLARAYEQQGETVRALETLQRLIREYPASRYVAEARFRVAEGLFVEQRYGEAAAAYGKILDKKEGNPYYYHALYKRGWSLYRLGSYRQALEDFFAVLEHHDASPDPRGGADREMYADAQRAINMCFSSLKGPASIEEFFASGRYQRYIEAAYQSLAEYYLAQERFSDAVATWSTYIRNYPDSESAPRYLVRIIATWREQGFEENMVAAQEQLIERYGLRSPFWSSHQAAQFDDVRAALKRATRSLAEHYHAAARQSGKREEFLRAADWYRRYLQDYPAEPDAAELNYLYAEILEEAGRYRAAVAEFGSVVENYPRFARRAEAGYAAVVIAFRQMESSPEGEREWWREQGFRTALEFARLFPDDTRALDVLLHLAEDSYRRGEYQQAIMLATRVTGSGGVRQRQQALLVMGHSQFESGKYLSAEQTYRTLLQTGRVAKDRRREINRRMALAIYRQGEAARDAGDLSGAVRHFLRVREEVPASTIVANAEYDAAAGLIAMERWSDAIEVLERFREEQPGHPLQQEVTRKLALAYLSSEQPLLAAREFEQLAVVESDAAKRSAALWKAAELYDDNGYLEQAAELFQRYVKEYPAPFDVALEARQKLVAIYSRSGDDRRRDYWRRQIIEADRSAPVSNERSRYLAMSAALEIADAKYGEYLAAQLTIPLKQSLRRKKRLLKQAIDAYALVAGYGDASTITRAGYQIGEIYYQFSRALMDSERPAGLDEEELEQYNLLLEEQAFPFEEKALEFYRSNRVRITEGLYDEWIQKSLDRLAEIFPARYARPEKHDAYVEALE